MTNSNAQGSRKAEAQMSHVKWKEVTCLAQASMITFSAFVSAARLNVS